MPQTTDIVLDGAGYMVLPGSYRRMQDGIAEGRMGRISLSDFFGGQRRALQLERDRGWDAPGVGPALFGQGVEPWPFSQSYTDGVITTVTTVRAPHLVVGDNAYIAVGRFLFKSVSLAASAWGDFTQVADVGAGKTITRLAYYQGNIALCCGNGLDVQIYPIAGGALTTLAAGLKARIGIGYANRLVFADPATGNEVLLKMTTGAAVDTRELDAPIVNMGLHDGKVVIATRQSLWFLGGRVDPTSNKWTADPVPFFTHGVWSDDEDFLFLLSFGGKLYTWLANQVMEWNPNEGSSRQGWRAIGLEGRSCYGATVTGGYLVVCIVNRNGESETWAFDGSGWWLMLRSQSQTRIWPMHTGGAGNIDLVAFRDGSASVTYDLFRLVYRHESATSYAPSAEYRTSLLDAGDRGRQKAWRAIGATFASPEPRGNQASVDAVSLTLSYSIDGGNTFTTAATISTSDPTERAFELAGVIGNNVATSTTIMLKLNWTSVSDWAPVMTGLWADFELLDSPARRRKWSFSVLARDAAVQRDGSASTRTGRELAFDLWQGWQEGATIVLRDIDFDLTSELYQVRIVDITEEVPKPSTFGESAASVIGLTLVEV